ncbi:hypothetical protein XELAEV_18001711mg [Xenopus laevis]|nr:hypothetical protein XELAEV_18001711mg [Xenopus laevis]
MPIRFSCSSRSQRAIACFTDHLPPAQSHSLTSSETLCNECLLSTLPASLLVSIPSYLRFFSLALKSVQGYNPPI